MAGRYELGNYLGGGVAGVVYEAERCGANQHFALKILNPVGYKLERKATLKQVCFGWPFIHTWAVAARPRRVWFAFCFGGLMGRDWVPRPPPPHAPTP
jgi:hypothetical protein